jgi:hypothetical protein
MDLLSMESLSDGDEKREWPNSTSAAQFLVAIAALRLLSGLIGTADGKAIGSLCQNNATNF